jgi:hypothetical protein
MEPSGTRPTMIPQFPENRELIREYFRIFGSVFHPFLDEKIKYITIRL